MQSIITALVDACEPYSLPARWERIPCDRSFVRFPAARADVLLAELRERFGNVALIKAGIALAKGANLRWLPALANSQDPLWVQTLQRSGNDEGDEITAVVAGSEVLGKNISLLSLIFSQWPDGFIHQPSRDFIVTETMMDFAVLRSVGIDAIPVAALTPLGPQRLKFLCEELNMGMPGRTCDVQRTTNRLDFANWSISGLVPCEAPEVRILWNEFINFHNKLDVRCSDFRLWTPSNENIEKVEMRLQYLEPDQVQQILRHSLRSDSHSIQELTTPALSEVERYLETLRKSREIRQRNSGGTLDLSASTQILDARERERLEPIVRQAFATRDLSQRERLLGLADATQLALLAQHDFIEQIGQTAAKGDLPESARLASNSTADYCRLEKLRLAMLKDQEKCTKPASPPKHAIPRKAPASYRPWASCARKSPP